MRILICPDSFKDSASAPAAAAALARGLRRALPAADLVELPLADGGEGTVEALVAATAGALRRTTVTGPRGEAVDARWGLLGDGATAVIEMAEASGLELLAPAHRDARVTTTRGTGELICAALDAGARALIVGIGGSATNDGGAGMAQALGARLLDADGRPLPPGGAALASLHRIDTAALDPRLREAQVRVASDVDNPLCGERGASRVYGPQKGASPDAVTELDAALSHYADIVERDLGVDVRTTPGAGAAGGLGAGLMAFCGARLQSGIDLVLDAVGFDAALAGADLVVTGEGRIDESTLHGKTVHGVVRRAGAVPVVAVGGAVTVARERWLAAGLHAVVPLPARPMTLEEALPETLPALERVGEMIGRLGALGLG